MHPPARPSCAAGVGGADARSLPLPEFPAAVGGGLPGGAGEPSTPAASPEDARSQALLTEAVEAILAGRPAPFTLEELYRAVEDRCVHRRAPALLAALRTQLEAGAGAVVQRLSKSPKEPAIFLKAAHAEWERFCGQLVQIRQIFLYLDRSAAVQASPAGSLFAVGLECLRSHFQAQESATTDLVTGVLALVQAERAAAEQAPAPGNAGGAGEGSGASIHGVERAGARAGEGAEAGAGAGLASHLHPHRPLLKTVVQMMVALDLYATYTEPRLLAETGTHYQAFAEAESRARDGAGYLQASARALEEEAERCEAYLGPETLRPLVAAVEHQVLSQHRCGEILARGFSDLMMASEHASLKLLERLFGRVGRQRDVREALREWVAARVRDCVEDPERDRQMVTALLDLKILSDRAVECAFGGDSEFARAVKDAFESSINTRQNRPAELLAKHIDARMRGGSTSKGLGEDELEAEFDQLIVLFRYVHGKDVFEAFYKKDLAKRLLLGRSGSIDVEKAMIARLKSECGAGFTQKIEGMFKDVQASKDLMGSYRDSAPDQEKLRGSDMDMNVSVLTQSFWPTYQQVQVNLPAEMLLQQGVFKDFYLSKHSGRRLHWHDSLGQCVLKVNFDGGKKEVVTSLFQALVLLLFQDVDELPVSAIAQSTALEGGDLFRTVGSLTSRRAPLLRVRRAGAAPGTMESPGAGEGGLAPGSRLDPDDVIVFNRGFKAPAYRVKVNNLQLKESTEEREATSERVIQDRQYQVDAAVVRIMKTRKTLSHVLLMNELVQQLKFTVRPPDLKKRIESLIEREYLERDSQKASVYHYVA